MLPSPVARFPIRHARRQLEAVLAVASASLAALLSGCANPSGLGGDSAFGCKAPAGVPCMSITGVEANLRAGNLPAQRATPTIARGDDTRPMPSAPTAAVATATTGTTVPRAEVAEVQAGPAPEAVPRPLRSSPRLMRIWLAPWEDADGDLIDQTYVYLQVDSGRWLVDRATERARIATVDPMPTSPAIPVRPATDTAGPKPPAAGGPTPAAAGQATGAAR